MSKETGIAIDDPKIRNIANDRFVDKVVDAGKDLWDNVVWGTYDITLDNVERIEDGSEDIGYRLLKWFKRTFTNEKKQSRVVEEPKVLSTITHEIGEDIKGVAMVGEDTIVEGVKEIVKTGEDVLIGGYIATKDLVIREEKKEKEIVEKEKNEGWWNLVKNRWSTSIENAKNNPTGPTGSAETLLEAFEDSIEMEKDTTSLADRATNFVESFAISKLYQKFLNFLEAGSDFLIILSVLFLLGRFDFVLKNTYTTLIMAILIVYFILDP